MSALTWDWYMPPHVQESTDKKWRIYRSIDARTKTVIYTLMHKDCDGVMQQVRQAPTAIECRNTAQEMMEDEA